ncbi:5'-AMP-activated protein kinase, gamma subunit [Handroanthus impetiginosus]|uniref:5'-AMP-activated protein kinase, gamma subunit n=1 Tax=Handroanthus impetiginosus TaxID=429701 RepID=A0A2G9HFT1_9LAMI|nr:5'-AMP-activated protein kinase, gamma subunit [Handroanthus impetiginosus]
MQSTKTEERTTAAQGGASSPQLQRVRDKKVKELISDKRRLVEVPYTASLADTMNTLIANGVMAVPVAAPPGQWIGAGGSMILESDKQTGAVRKHYIGMVTMLDFLAHIAGNHVEPAAGGEDGNDLDRQMQTPVSSVIGHCLETLSLWTLNINTSILDCMEVFSKGIHRALVPVDGHLGKVAGVELNESASSYRMVTQMDLLKLLKAHEHELEGILTRRVKELGAMSDVVFGITNKTKVIDAIKSMNMASLHAVPIVESTDGTVEKDHSQLINAKDRKIVGTFSATDLRGCTPMHEATCLRTSTRELIICRPESLLGEVVDKVINNHVHRVWVVDEKGLLVGVASLTDLIRVIRAWMLLGPA